MPRLPIDPSKRLEHAITSEQRSSMALDDKIWMLLDDALVDVTVTAFGDEGVLVRDGLGNHHGFTWASLDTIPRLFAKWFRVR